MNSRIGVELGSDDSPILVFCSVAIWPWFVSLITGASIIAFTASFLLEPLSLCKPVSEKDCSCTTLSCLTFNICLLTSVPTNIESRFLIRDKKNHYELLCFICVWSRNIVFYTLLERH